jgi:outer membrane immunogenic protein
MELVLASRGELGMRSIALASILLLGAAWSASAQDSSRGDVALTYHWVRSNTSPGNCGCFGMNGGAVSGSWYLSSRLSALAEISTENASNVLSPGKSLTLTSYMAGARYRIAGASPYRGRRLQPFAQLLVGTAHAGGGIVGRGDGSYAFASRVGGGIDMPVSSHIAIRIFQIDYYLTHFANLSNDHQNNLLLGAGIVLRWG